MRVLQSVLLSLWVVCYCTAEDMVGCGGFVRSKYLSNFSRIKVNLHTKSGTLKYKTECAPNNGYFLIPLYDKGEYALRVDPPEGWSFSPSEVVLVVDGKTDQCSRGEDINFDHVGFSIYGQVLSSGADTGPSGVTVKLQQSGDVLMETETTDLGRFVLSGLAPGTYQLTASHPIWKVAETVLNVEVVEDSTAAPAGLQVLGYDVSGQVSSRGDPVSGVQLLLYSHGNTKVDCPSSSPLPDGPRAQRPHCAAESNSEGRFSFPALPPGQYTLVPYYRHEQIVFEVHPPELLLTISDDSVLVMPPFEVQGFSVTGKVLLSEKGKGVGGAKVFVNGHFAATTDDTGSYQLSNITSGSYKLLVEAPQLEFTEVTTSISPQDPYLPDLTPARFQVCGEVTLSVPPPPSSSGKSSRMIQVFSGAELGKQATPTTTVPTDQHDKFCAMLPPGQYVVKAVVTEGEKEWGLSLEPPLQEITVSHSPLSGLVFSQFTATLTGTLSCIAQCPHGVSVSLSQIKQGRQQLSTTMTPTGNTGHFTFTSVLPGTVDVAISYPDWCWEVETIAVAIASGSVPSLHFVQTGFAMDCTASHDVTIMATVHNDTGTEFSLQKGPNRVCLAKPGLYSVTPISCYVFESDAYSFDSSAPAPLVLNAVAHTVSASVVSPTDRTDDITLRVRSLQFGGEEKVITATEVTELTKEDSKQYMLHFSIVAKYADVLEIVPQSSDLLFIPSQRIFTVSRVCPERVPPFEGSPGVIISGKVGPQPIVGVAIVVDVEGDIIEAVTDEAGKYRVGPVHGGKQYTVSAQLSGYIFKADPKDPHSFTSLKLGHIKITVLDSQLHSPLPSVLVSLSGSDGFRRNNFTREDGQLEYHDLVPGQYFLKPILREYELSPSSTALELQQGGIEEVAFSGERVAFGCSGKVTSLNGHPLEGVLVMVRGKEGSGCADVSDESTTSESGLFSFRGLQPDCEFSVSVETGDLSEVNHTIPNTHNIKLGKRDTERVNFVAIFTTRSIYISGNVLTDPKHFPTLQVHVFAERGLESALVATGMDSIGFFELPPLPLREEDYHIVIDTNLPSHFYRFTRPEIAVAGNEDRHITVTFSVESIKFSEEHSHGSLAALIIALIVVFAAVNFNKIYGVIEGYFNANNRT